MKIRILLFVGLFMCGLPFVEAQSREGIGFFSATFHSIENKTVKTASERVAGVLKVEPDQIEQFVRRGVFIDEDRFLLNACRYKSDSDIASRYEVTKLQENECANAILEMWKEEYDIAEKEVTEFQKTNAFARWWDGSLDSDEDFDIYADLHLFDRQFFDLLAPPSDAPSSSQITRDFLSLTQTGFRMPADTPPFDARGNCGTDETSLYGGLVCIPQFCVNFMCVKIKAVPGRRGVVVPGQQKEASVNNAITDLYEMSKLLHDAKQLTPTRNTNAAHWWSQLFNFDQLLRANIKIESKTPPILAEFASNEASDSDKNYSYGLQNGQFTVTDNTSGAVAEAEPTPEEVDENGPVVKGFREQIREELHRVRDEEFDSCEAGKQECESEDVLATFFEDCALYLGRTYWGTNQRNMLRCLEEKLADLPAGLSDSDNTNLQQVKQEFYKELPDNLDMLWKEVATLERQMMGLNLCAIRQAKYRCGTKKIDCTLYGGQ